jgi:hypothetical protein
MRLLSGLLFGAGVVGFGFPYLQEWFDDIASEIESRGESFSSGDEPHPHSQRVI